MPDIKTALEQALSKTAHAWAADDEAHNQIQTPQEKPVTAPAASNVLNDGRIVNNVSRTVFNFIHHNAGITRQEARERLVAQGFKDSSVTSLISQMLRAGMVRMHSDSEALFTTRQEYAPIQITNKTKPKPKHQYQHKVVEITRKPRTEPMGDAEEEPLPETRPYQAPAPLPTLPSVEYILKNMSVQDAFALYRELATMFGGK